jgi:hypothetical protein
MHQPKIEPGSHRWQRCILQLDRWWSAIIPSRPAIRPAAMCSENRIIFEPPRPAGGGRPGGVPDAFLVHRLWHSVTMPRREGPPANDIGKAQGSRWPGTTDAHFCVCIVMNKCGLQTTATFPRKQHPRFDESSKPHAQLEPTI